MIFLRRLIKEIRVRREASLILCFVDLANAFDSVPRRQLEAILKAYRVPDVFVAAILSLHCGHTVRVDTWAGKTPPIEIIQGYFRETR